MSTVIKPPALISINRFSVFLAGSIEMGQAMDWQKKLEKYLEHLPIIILNPRRGDWDASWEQKKTNPNFKGQVDWELNGLSLAHCIAMYFDPATKAPITLLELGLFANTGTVVVCCPEGYWRKGNVDIVCDRYKITQVETLERLADEIVHRYNEWKKCS